MRCVRLISLVLLAAPLGGCLVGPDYKGPDSAAPLAESGRNFRRASLVAVRQVEPASAWWRSFDDPLLTRLIERSFVDSPSVDMAAAKVRQARAAARQQVANLYPSASLDGASIYNRIPLGSLSETLLRGTSRIGGETAVVGSELAARVPATAGLSIYDTNLLASWELDLFGGGRRGVEAATAQADAVDAQLADAHVQLAAQVAQAYVSLRDAQGRLDLTLKAVRIEQKSLDLTAERFQKGTAADSDVQRLRTQLEQTKASAEPLRYSIDQSLTQLATFAGYETGFLEAELRRPHGLPRLPARFAVGDPAGVLRRRPDIRQAERSLAAANAQIGQSVAALFPKITLLGNIGTLSFSPGGFATAGSFLANAGPTLSWNVIDFGRNLAKIQQNEAGTDAAFAQYKSTVLSALSDAENALSQYGRTGAQVAALARATEAAAKAADLTRQSQQGGTASVIDLLNVEQQRLQTELNLAQARAQLVNVYVMLQKSLGLGWSDRPPGSPPEGRS